MEATEVGLRYITEMLGSLEQNLVLDLRSNKEAVELYEQA